VSAFEVGEQCLATRIAAQLTFTSRVVTSKLPRKEKTMKRCSCIRNFLLLSLLFAGFHLLTPSTARAQNSVGGHIGVAFPLVTRAGGETTTLGDSFTTAVPMGVTIKRAGSRLAIDFEIVPVVKNNPRKVDLTIHPGAIWDLRRGYAAGIRAAFDVNQSSWGFTPLLAKGFSIAQDSPTKFFVEFDLPVRFQKPTPGKTVTAVTFAVHTGISF
jgi:hypothetical protein